MKNFKLLTALTLIFVMFSGFSFGKNDDEKRAERLAESKEALELLYKEEPQTKEAIKSAYGYATFQAYGLNLMVISAEGGRGLAHNSKTGKVTYMNMGSGGMGFGLGGKEFMAVFIFDNKKVFDDFVNNGWEANAQADVAWQSNEEGNSVNETYTVAKNVKLYKLTKTGLAMQVTMQGSKFWDDKDLN